MEYPKRIEALMEAIKVNQTGLSRLLGVSRGIISEFSSGAREPSKDFLFGISKIGVSLDWFVSGEGPMFRDNIHPGEGYLDALRSGAIRFRPAKVIEESHTSAEVDSLAPGDPLSMSESPRVPVVRSASDLPESDSVMYYSPKGQMVRPDDLVQVPLLPQKVSAGAGQELIDYTESLGAIPVLRRMLRGRSPAGAYAMEVVGDSMTGERIFGGDIVIFYKDMVEDNGLYILAKDSSLLVKRLTFSFASKKVKISSANERYPEIEEVDDSQALAIIGKVLGWIHVHPY